MPLTRLTPIDGDAILPLADAKLHLRVTHTDEDALIASLRDAAIGHIERISGVALAEADYTWSGRYFPNRIDLPVGPVTALGEVAYHDEDGAEATYTGARLIEGSVWPSLTEAWPYPHGYAAVTFTAGLTAPEDAPELLAAVKLLLGHLYENRSAVNVGNTATEVPLAVDALVQTYRKVMV